MGKLYFYTILLFLSLSGSLFSQTASSSAKNVLFFEKVYLHVDREYYYAGEDIWFKAYLLNGQANHLLTTSNNLYVELINSKSQIEARKVIRLEKGVGKGDFKLRDTIPAGVYRVRAYTNWMLNFGDNFIFEKKINVSADENLLSKSRSAGVSKTSVEPAATSQPYGLIRFFPEGGSMIDDVTGLVAFKAEDASGKGIRAKGSILNPQGDTISIFESNDLGLGSFTIKPRIGIKYIVKGVYGDKSSIKADFPEALPQGFSIHLRPDSSKVTAIVSTNEATFSQFRGKELEVKVKHAGLSYFTAKFILKDLITKIIIPNSGLPEGVAWVTLSDDQLRSHAERLVYIDNGNDEDKIALSTNKSFYKAKEQVTLRIKTSSGNNQPVKANLSIAVIDAGIIPENSGNIVSYVNLESEVRGKIENPARYFDQNNPNRFKELDLLLLTQGWRDFVWKRVKDTTLVISHLNERGFTISGQVTERSGKKPLPGANVSLFAGGARGQKLLGTQTDQSGKYYFDNMNLEGSQMIRLISSDLKGKKVGAIFLDSLYTKPLSVRPAPSLPSSSSQLSALRKELSRRLEEMKRFSLSDSVVLKEVQIKGSKTVRLLDQVVQSFGYPDQSFVITAKDSKDYSSLSHYLFTNVDGAFPDPDGPGVYFMASGEKLRPRFIVDRREDVFDRLDYYSLQMKDVEKITVRHMVGMSQEVNSRPRGGIRDVFLIYLTLKPTAFSRKEPALLNARVNGYYQERAFYEPRYPNGAISRSDMRTTIHWQPIVTTNENGDAIINFYNADPKTKVRVVAEGVNEKGMPVSATLIYEVR